MKKTIAMLLAAVMVLSMAACGASAPAQSAAPAEEAKTATAAPAAGTETKPAEPETEEASAPAAKPETYDELLAAARAAGSDYTIGYLAMSMSIQWIQDMDTAFRELSELWGFRYIMYDAQSDVETQVNQLQTMLDQGVDAIVTIIADQGMSQIMVDMCREYGVPLIGESKRLRSDDNVLVGPGVELSGALCGGMCADWIYENYQALGFGAMADDWSKVGYITTTKSTTASNEERSDGAWNEWKKLVPGFPDENRFISDVVADTAATDFTQATYNQCAAIFAANPDIEYWLVTATLEEHGQGAVRCAEDNGVAERTIVTSIGGELATGEWESGMTSCWYAASYFEAMDCARLCIQGLYDYLLNGIDYEAMYDEWREGDAEFACAKFAGVMVTPDNYTEYMS